MNLKDALEIHEELGGGIPELKNEALEVILDTLNINDGTCMDCGPYKFMKKGDYIHPFTCPNTKRRDHNIYGLRDLIDIKY